MFRDKKEVIKHSAAIHIQNNITLLQRRAWNVLLANAYDELPTEETHSINVRGLMRALDFDSGNQDYLKEALKALATCGIEWNVLSKDNKQQWGVTTLLAEARIEDGVCVYAFGPTLRRYLYNPKIYARISLSLQNKFDSKHALALWELCLDYLDDSKNYGETPFIQLENYRKLMGISGNMYPEFKKLNTRVVKEPIKEINRATDFQVETDYQRKGRKVVAVKFKVRRELELSHYYEKQGDMFPHLEDMPVTVKMLEDAGLSADDAWEIYQNGFNYVRADKRPVDLGDHPERDFAYYVREKVNLLKRLQKQGKIKNATGFLREAIKQNYANPEFTEEQKSDAVQNDEMKKYIKKKELQEQQCQLEKEYGQQLSDLCEQIANDDPALLEQITQEILEVPFNRSQYDPKKSPVENYLNTQGLRSLINEQIMAECVERFKPIHEEYEKQMTDLETQIEATGSLMSPGSTSTPRTDIQ